MKKDNAVSMCFHGKKTALFKNNASIHQQSMHGLTASGTRRRTAIVNTSVDVDDLDSCKLDYDRERA